MSDEQLPTGDGVDLSAHSSFAPTKAAAAPAPAKVPNVPAGEGVDLDQHSTFSPVKVTQQKTDTPPEPGMLDVANKAYEGEPAKPMALSTEYGGNLLRRIGSGVGRTLMAAPNMAVGAYHAATDPSTTEEAGLTDPQRLAKRMLVDPSTQAIQQEKQHEATDTAAGMPHSTAEKVLNRAVSAVPMVGPFVEGEGQRAGKGDIAGAVTDVAGMEALGRFGNEAGPGLKEMAPVAKEVATAPIRAASRAAQHIAPAAPILGEMAAGFPGRMAAGALKSTIAGALEKGTVVGLPELEATARTLEGRADVAAKAVDKAQSDADLYKASHVPENVNKALTKAKEAAADAKMHADAAREAATVSKTKHTGPDVPAAQIEAKPAEPVPMAKLGEPKPPVPAMNVKTPGQIQPETFPQEPKEAPMVRPGQQELAGGQGRMGRTLMLPEAPQQFPQEVLPPETKAPTAPETKAPTTLQQGPGKLAATEPEAKAAPTVPPVKPEDLRSQIEQGLGNKPIEPGVPMKDQGAKAPEAAAEPEKLSSRPDKAMLQKAKATPEEIEKILPLTRVELSKLAGHFDIDLGDKAIGREKVASGTKIAREEVLQNIVDAGHSTADIAAAIDEGKHLPTVSGGSQGADNEDQAAAHNENGGSTFHPTKGNLNGTDHFSVGGDPAFRKPELTMTTDGKSLTAAQLDEYKNRPAVKEALAKDKDASVGSWHDTETGKTTTELTKTPTDRETAINMGKANNQKAIYDLKTGTEIPTGGTGETVEKPRVAADIGEWKAPPELGAFSAEDVGAKVRAKNPEPAGRGAEPERRSVAREAQAADDKVFAQARKELGEDADHDAISKRVQELKAAPKATGYSQKADQRYPATTKYAAPEKGIPETSLAKGPEAEAAQAATVASDKLAEEWKKAGEKPKAETEKFPPSAYEDKGGFHEVITGPQSGLGHLAARDVSEDTVQVMSHWVSKEARGKGLGAQQLETLADSLAPEKKTLLSDDEMTDSAKGSWEKFMKRNPESVTKTDNGYSVDLDKLRGVQAELPKISGGSQGAGAAQAKEGALPKLAEEHTTAEEKAGVSKSNVGRERFIDNLEKVPPLHEWVDAAKGGEGAKHWYQRSGKAFDALHEEAPKYFQDGDREKWGNFVASLSPQQMVHNNLREALHAWTQWVDDGRPLEDKALEKSLRDSIKSVPDTKVPNAMLSLKGESLWPDLTKNRNFKVASFGKNLNGYLNHVTNDGWQALFGGLDAKQVSSPSSYHPLSVMTRAAADALGWEPAEAQAAIWSFTQALKEQGEVDPHILRQYSEDFSDIMAHNHEVRNQLKNLGVDLGKLDTKLKAIGEKPEVTPGASASTEHSTRQLAERIETARGKGAIPPAKSAQGNLFREAPAGESRARVPDEDTSFNFGAKSTEPVMEKLGKKKSPVRTMR